jgi:iron complex outermembrane receptor protein
LTYRPTPHFTIFAAFRNGFTSGGFNTGTTPTSLTGTRIDYQPETARGFETGIKAVEGPISADLTAYSYLYKELQLSTFDPATLAQQVINAGSARVEGVETDVSWKTPIDGLTLRASGDYNRARYSRFLDDCYTGQTIDEGCNANAIAGAYTEQNLSGRPLILAPQVTGSAGFSFAQAIGNLKASLSSDVNFSSNFFAQLEETPAVRQGGFAMIDAAVHVGRPDDRWELALIGRNLSDVYRSRYVSQVPLTGNPALTGTATPGGVSDYSGQINRGREARIQLKVKFK